MLALATICFKNTEESASYRLTKDENVKEKSGYTPVLAIMGLLAVAWLVLRGRNG